MPRLRAIALVSWLAFASSVSAGSVAGDLLWHDQLDLAGGEDLGAAMAADAGRVIVVGSVHQADGNRDFLVRAVDAHSGLLLWQDQVDVDGADDTGIAVVMDGRRIVVAGRSRQPGANPSLILRSYHPRNGTLEWELRSPDAFVTGVGMDDGRVLIVGSAPISPGSFVAGPSFIRAYDARSGVLLWEDNHVPGGQYLLEHLLGKRIVVHGDTAFIVTTLHDSTTDFQRCVVRAYHTREGRLLWESLSGAGTCRATAIAAERGQVFVAGQTGSFEDDFHIRAFSATTGKERWRRQSGIFSGRENAALAIDVERRLVFVAGWRFAATGSDHDVFLVHAYQADTGELRWQDAFESDVRCLCRARDIVAHAGHVFAAGDAGGGRQWLIRAYDASDGTVVWHDEFLFAGTPAPSGDNALLGPRAVTVLDGRLFVAGSGVSIAGDGDVVVRAYDAR